MYPVTRMTRTSTPQGTGSWPQVCAPHAGACGTSGKAPANILEQPSDPGSPSCRNKCTVQVACPVYQKDGTHYKTPWAAEMVPSRDPLQDPSFCSSGSTTPHKGWAGRLAHASSSSLPQRCTPHRAKRLDDGWAQCRVAGRSNCVVPRTAGG
eukprot:225835-Amphidinium_carterae.2